MTRGAELTLLIGPGTPQPAPPAVTSALQSVQVTSGTDRAGFQLVFPALRTPVEGIPTQTGTDLEYIKQHAQRCGYVFYLEPGPAPGSSIAYFGPDVRIPTPQPALTVNMGAHTNVESLSFGLDGTA